MEDETQYRYREDGYVEARNSLNPEWNIVGRYTNKPEAKSPRNIGKIGNYYGSLAVLMKDDQYYWGIDNYDGPYWEEIPKSLFDELNRFQDMSESKH